MSVGVILGTPEFWSEITVCGYSWPENSTQNLRLLRTSLDRGESYPLSLSIDLTDFSESTATSVLDLIMEHSERWQSASFNVGRGMVGMQIMLRIKGRLGMLERIDMQFSDFSGDIAGINLSLPWKQLCSFIYQCKQNEDIAGSLSLMHNLYPHAAFELRGFDPRGHDRSLALPLITARISSFLIAPSTKRDPEEARQVLGNLLGSLTLPHLFKFSVDRARDWFRGAIFWPSHQFESLATRSAFSETLHTLELPYVTITAHELFCLLACLAPLEHLVIADREETSARWEHILITDALLQGLTTTPNSPDSCLVPKLNYFVCTSSFGFIADIYFDFVTSRIRTARKPFHNVLRYFSGTSCALEPNLLNRLLELVDKGELNFNLEEESYEYPNQVNKITFLFPPALTVAH
ncbi:hypothetical protein B0H17DRAFT_1125565 [Mycena rosella]|uniref:Uncharacterized protein n=1 Tax=Mycena rosella TaxID=1033263 RepID=A0AAD7GW97_MYCRO|nr:hypothetical protein B0H17DRAFT_1125565 [Mycena rosella]